MPTTLQFRRDTTAGVSGITGAIGEIIVDTTKKTVTVHDGSTAGGTPLAKETDTRIVNALQPSDVDDTPVNGATTAPISSNWAYDHIDTDGATTAIHHTLGTGANQAVAGNDSRLSDSRIPVITNLTDINDALVDGDELPVYDLSVTTTKKSAISRFWTYIASKLSAYTGDLTAKSFSLNQNISQAAWTTTGVRHKNTSVTITDTSSSGTVAAAYTNRFGGNTIAATNSTVFTDYATNYFDAPVAGTNVTFTHSWAAIFNGAVKALFRDITESIYYHECTANVTIDWANGDVQYLYVNPAGASIQITMPADPGAISKAGILFVKNNTGKAHTWNSSPAIRFVGEADADTVPTPAAVGYYTRYTCQWNDYDSAWWVTVAGRNTA